MTITHLSVSVENNHLEPFEDRIDILFREIELATKWQRPSVLWAIYNSEYVRSDADLALENRLHNLGQRTHHIKIQNQEGADISVQISKLINLENVVIFVEGLRWGAGHTDGNVYHALNNRLEFFVDHQVRVVFWLTEREAIDLAHFSPDYWAARHRVIEFVDSPKPDQISPHILESVWQGTGEFTDPKEDLDAKIALRTALLTDLPTGDESTAARTNLLLTLGMLHWRRGDYERSTLFLNTALDDAAMLEDDYFEALCFNAIALVQTEQGRIEEAVQAYQNAISLAPDQITPWNNLGHLYRQLGRHADALAAFQKAIEHNGSDAVGWNGLGDLYHETGQIDDAVHAYLKAIEISPDYAHPWCGIGDSHLAEGRLDEALSAHRKAIEIDRRIVKSWLGLGEIYRMQGDNKNASMAYRTALELDPRNALGWNALGNLCFEAGEYDEAMRSYQKSIELPQSCSQTYGNLASIYILKGLHKEAIPLLLKALEHPEDITGSTRLWNQLGDAYRQVDEYDNAMDAYRHADALKSEATSSQGELSIHELPPQPAPMEDVSGQTGSRLELDLTMEEPLGSETSYPNKEDLLEPETSNPNKEELLQPEASSPAKEEPLEPEASHPSKEQPQPEASCPAREESLDSEASDPTKEQPLQPEASSSAREESLEPEAFNPILEDSSENPTIHEDDDPHSTKPEAEFLAWLDDLGTGQPVPSQSEVAGSVLPGSIEGDAMEAVPDSKAESDSQPCDTGNPSRPVEIKTCNTCEPSSEYSEVQVLSDKPVEEELPISSTDQPLNSSQIVLEGADSIPAPLDQDDSAEKETPLMDEGPSHEFKPENEDTHQVQLTINEKNAQIWNELGNIYYNTGAFDEALHAFEMATELDPCYGWSYYNLASIYIHFKRYSEAIPLYEKSLQLLNDQKDQALLWNRMGDAYRRLNKHDQAVTAYRNAIELDPENVSLLTRARFSLLGNLRV